MGFSLRLGAAEMIAVEGLRRYGFDADAERISMKFLSLVKREYRRVGYIVEKYDVVNGGSNVTAIHFGYSANQAGFGWTNAVFLELLGGLTQPDRETSAVRARTKNAVRENRAMATG